MLFEKIPHFQRLVLPKISLRLVLIGPVVLQVLAIAALTGYLSWRNGSEAVSESASRLSEEVTHRIDNHLRSLSEPPYLLLQWNAIAVKNGSLDVTNFEKLRQTFWQQTSLSSSVQTLYFANPQGDFLQIDRNQTPTMTQRDADTVPNWEVYSVDSEGNPLELLRQQPYDPRTRPWYQKAIETQKPVWSDIYVFADPVVLGITPTVPLYDSEDSLLGVMAVDLTLQQISDFLSRLSLSQMGTVFIVERNGDLVASSTGEVAVATSETPKRLQAVDSEAVQVRDTARALQARLGDWQEIDKPEQISQEINEEVVYLRVTPFRDERGLDWLVVTAIPEDNFVGQIQANTRATIVLCAIALVGSTILALFTSRWIARPIWRFARTSQAIAHQSTFSLSGEDLHLPVPGSRIHEFAMLSEALNQMLVQLHQSQADLQLKVEERTEALSQEMRDRLSAEDKFAKVFQSSPDPIAIVRLDNGCFVEVNESFLETTGYTLPETLGQTALGLNLWVSFRERYQLLAALRRTQAVHNKEVQFRVKSGEIRTVLLSAEILDLGGVDCVLYLVSDISDRVAVQHALQEAEARYRSIFENAAEGIFQIASQGEYLSVNPALAKMLGYESPEAFMAQQPQAQAFYVNRGDWLEFVEAIARQEAISKLEYQMQRRDGRQIWVSQNARVVRDRDGQIAYYEGTLENITRRKQAEASLIEKERYLRLVLDNIPQQVFWKDKDCIFLGCNRNWAQAAQLGDPDTVIGLTDYDLLPPLVADRFREADRRVMDRNQAEFNQVEMKQKPAPNGQRSWLDVSKIPIQDELGEVIGILGVIEDITQRKHAEEALRREQQKSESLLLNILPSAIAKRLKENPGAIAEQFDQVTILFADIVGFTPLSARLPATELVQFLNKIVSEFDQLAAQLGLEKIKTIGDAYMVAGGLPVPRRDHADAIAQMALGMQERIAKVSEAFGEPLQLRIGINSGPVVAGVIGVAKFIYDLWGDTVNVASRMESLGQASRIQTTNATYELLKSVYRFEKRGTIEVKGKGAMTTYWLLGKY
ncbi:MAG: adenylate/guanylate cyclase domain-containing protein [Jaaginema sp. PMC 1079.18]|nr:adenylate/guanylate cyclase domain-containing protein [Jaaginema sp. PMC 1080.18]MEC4851688.1 adenylate/guanylate cyclase domain-containing protein [Jaaginema sp. PMC 1079.18]MEC4867628.1 adenylate/guanylate cyclase domain-containing protein [Jaaginema sp. PMC 1078.18]